MRAKIVSSIIFSIIYILIAFFGFASMILAMNGYNDRAAESAIPAYIISQILFLVISTILVFFAVLTFQNKLKWNVYLSSIISIFIGLIFALILTFVAIGIGIGFGDWAFRN